MNALCVRITNMSPYDVRIQLCSLCVSVSICSIIATVESAVGNHLERKVETPGIANSRLVGGHLWRPDPSNLGKRGRLYVFQRTGGTSPASSLTRQVACCPLWGVLRGRWDGV